VRRRCSSPTFSGPGRIPPQPLILASASPQRRAILAQVGIPFEVRVAGVQEQAAGDPRRVAEENARRKALAVAAPGELVLGADTDVALDGDILGKPADAGQAREFIARLAGRDHQVVGGYAFADDDGVVSGVEVTTVRFRPLSRSLVDWYVARGEWQGRAGGYAIQGIGAALVEAIAGDYLNVVGLPLARLLTLRPELLGGGAPGDGPTG
jgi:septum formation protein